MEFKRAIPQKRYVLRFCMLLTVLIFLSGFGTAQTSDLYTKTFGSVGDHYQSQEQVAEMRNMFINTNGSGTATLKSGFLYVDGETVHLNETGYMYKEVGVNSSGTLDVSGEVSITSGDTMTGHLISQNLLHNVTAERLEHMIVTVPSLPENTGAAIALSRDKSTWYNSQLQAGEKTALQQGSNSFDLSAFRWPANQFYYKLFLNTTTEFSPSIDGVNISYSDTELNETVQANSTLSRINAQLEPAYPTLVLHTQQPRTFLYTLENENEEDIQLTVAMNGSAVSLADPAFNADNIVCSDGRNCTVTVPAKTETKIEVRLLAENAGIGNLTMYHGFNGTAQTTTTEIYATDTPPGEVFNMPGLSLAHIFIILVVAGIIQGILRQNYDMF